MVVRIVHRLRARARDLASARGVRGSRLAASRRSAAVLRVLFVSELRALMSEVAPHGAVRRK